ncbi:DUF932 domain-containing protein [Salinisphaera sp.]|uniref:DUF932 domain-containing protein n=1 Tax=Salinisphaera sp. TaxID=1914330 RepID=UPI000C4D16E0|nr:DUF932 domain-containing protein [Salinisphaera sp.]MAS08583.1 hypothetical protein [Salinisphaera sp.]
MAHEVQSMAYVGDTPWHGLGRRLDRDAALDVWLKEAGMDWEIQSAPVMYQADEGVGAFTIRSNPDTKVLYRSDTKAALSVVSSRYKMVQPKEVLEFYRDLVGVGGFELETAGVLKGGKKLWALARTGEELRLKGDDRVEGYLLLATACDGTLATTAQFTSVRVVCNNTLQVAVGDKGGAIKVPHSTRFDAEVVKSRLGIGAHAWVAFSDRVQELSERRVNRFESVNYLVNVFGDPAKRIDEQPNARAIKAVQNLYEGAGIGMQLPATNETAWGLLNAVTQYIDHDRPARSVDNRLNSAWFGAGATTKQRAWEEAMALVA